MNNNPITDEQSKIIDKRIDQIIEFQREIAKAILKFCLVANSSGIAIIVGLTSANSVSDFDYLLTGMASFLLGVISSALILFYILYRTKKLEKNCKQSTNKLYNQEISWLEWDRYDVEQTEKDRFEVLLLGFSFVMFSCGSVFSFLSLL